MKDNKVASALNVIGVLAIVSGVISGIYYGTNEEFAGLGGLQGIIGFSLFVNGLVWGIVFLGFSEIINLLQGLFNQGSTSFGNKSSNHGVSEINLEHNNVEKKLARKVAFIVSDLERKEILAFYSSKGLSVKEIKATNKEDFFLVALDDREEIVELGGFSPVIHAKKEEFSCLNLSSV